jgi:hypothetical protein
VYDDVFQCLAPMFTRIVRRIGYTIIKNRIFSNLYHRYYYQEGFLPVSAQEIKEFAIEIEALYNEVYLAP